MKQKGLTMHGSMVHGKAGFLSARVPIREGLPLLWCLDRHQVEACTAPEEWGTGLQTTSRHAPPFSADEYDAALESDRQVRRKSRLLGMGELAGAAGS